MMIAGTLEAGETLSGSLVLGVAPRGQSSISSIRTISIRITIMIGSIIAVTIAVTIVVIIIRPGPPGVPALPGARACAPGAADDALQHVVPRSKPRDPNPEE